jgi:hypothetical protein
MTNVVVKGTNRPAAAARTRKHAQRTPLPPREGITEEMLTQARHVAELQGMTVPEMRRYAVENSISIPSRISKADLLKAILLAEEEKAKPVEVESKPVEVDRSGETPEAEYRRLCALPISLRTAEQRERIRALRTEVIERNCAVSADVASRATSVAEEATTEAEAPEATGQTSEATTEQQGPSRVNVVEIATKRAEKEQKAAKPAKAAKPRETRSMARTKLLEERKAEKATAAKVPTQRASEESKPVEKSSEGTKSEAKAAAFIMSAKELGWDAKEQVTEGELTSVTVARGDERIEISWQAGVFVGETCLYYHPGRNAIKVHNASAAKKRMAMTPEASHAEASKVAAHRATRTPGSKPTERKPRALPFSETSLDQEVIDAVRGKTIVWTNSISGRQEEARVPADGERTKRGNVYEVSMKEGKAGRALSFTDSNGTHSVRVSSITEVR